MYSGFLGLQKKLVPLKQVPAKDGTFCTGMIDGCMLLLSRLPGWAERFMSDTNETHVKSQGEPARFFV